jgi:MtrB/PioB family decaheme-associated outer membrane protein
MRTTAAAAALLAAGMAVAGPSAVRAQNTSVTGGAEVGVRTFITEPADQQLAKFLQYRDVPSGLIWQSVYFRVARDSFTTLQLFGHNLGQQDQDLSLRANQPGTADVQLRWDRIPHVFSTNARFLGTESAPGIFTLPVPRPDTATLNRSPFVAPVKERWDPINGTLTLTPSPKWDFKVEYQHIDKNGDRPMGMAFGGSNNNAREINEPIDQSMNDLRLSQAYTQPHFQAMVSYAYSQFSNALQSVGSDNPLVTVDSLAAGTSRGRTALAPNNQAQTITGTAAVSLPRHTRVTGTLSYGWRSQNEAFIAPTINSKDLDSLTRAGYVFPTSLNGSIHTSLVNLTMTSRPIRPVTVSARYRSYDFKDETPEVSVPILVISDRTFAAGATSERFPYTQDNADVSVSVRPRAPFTVTAGYAWDRMDRDSAVRNVSRVTENTNRLSVDYTGLAWASVRLSYNHGERRGSEYYQLTTSENPDSRRFDEADRNQSNLDLMLTVTPIDQITLTGTYQVGRDTFPNSPDGVQRDNSNAIGAELDWTPIPRFLMGAGYLREWYNNQFDSRYRTGSTDATLNNATFTWVATNIDSSTTAYVTFSATLIPNRLELGGMWQISKSTFQMQAFNPVTPTGGTAAQNAAATAMTFPAATQELQPLTLNVRYRLSADWSLTARYQTEHFTNYNFQTTGLAPGTGNYVFEGNNLLPYDAKYFTILVAYRPGLLRLPRPAL